MLPTSDQSYLEDGSVFKAALCTYKFALSLKGDSPMLRRQHLPQISSLGRSRLKSKSKYFYIQNIIVKIRREMSNF